MPRTFHFFTVLPTPADVETLAAQALPLKRHGNVEFSANTQAEKTRADIPSGGSPWHEYTSHLPTLHKFYPHPKMTPFLDMSHIEKNRNLLRATVQILRRHGYTAGFYSHLPFFMPEPFFTAYPHLRGARCDHPRRSTQPAFAICPDHAESQQMYTEMMADLTRDVPELTWLRLSANDAGAGFCWSDWIYPGPNGPRHCRHIPTAKRVRNLCDALLKGARTNAPVELYMQGNFSDAELRELHIEMPNLQFAARMHRGSRPSNQVNVGSTIDNPVRGIFDPIGILRQLDGLKNPAVSRINIMLRFNYSRGRELDDTAEKVIGLIDAFCASPAHGTVDRLVFLRNMCGRWVGDKRRDDLLEALIALNEAYTIKSIAAPRFSGNYCGVSMRHINRPLVIVPELLTPEEEAYFLPHVFNPDVNEARIDYIDWHGGKLQAGTPDEQTVNASPRLPAIDKFCDTLHSIAGTLADLGDSPDAQFFARMGTSLRLYSCVIRSVHNFFTAGTVRDRNKGKLSGPPHIPPKLGDWIGDPDLQILNATMRDELDNTAELLRLLQNGGKERMLLADKPEDEDTFLLGPNLIDNLKQKSEIMTRHWIDAQQYMSTPHK